MSLADFFLGPSEVESLVNYMFETPISVVPNVEYAARRYEELRSPDRVMELALKPLNPSMYVLSPQFSTHRLEMWSYRNNTYEIRQRAGGPYLTFMPPRALPNWNNVEYLANGSISLYPSFEIRGAEVPTPPALRSYFRRLRRFLEKRWPKYAVIKQKPYFVGDEAARLICSGIQTNVEQISDLVRKDPRNRRYL
jgi:hypothetical protein